MPSDEAAGTSTGSGGGYTRSTRVITLLAVFYTIYLSETLLLPVVIAALLALFCNPLVTVLHHYRVPKPVAALLVMAAITGCTAGTVTLLAQPAQKWVRAIPYATAELGAQLNEVTNPLEKPESSPTAGPSDEEGGGLTAQVRDRFVSTAVGFLLNSTGILLTQILAVIILVYFFLVYGPGLLRRLVKIRPTMSQKRTAVVIVRSIQTDVSYYILVVAIINAGLGIATGLALWALGVRDPALWGAMAALLNFAPYLGPFLITLTLAFVGLIQFGMGGYAILVPLTFLALNFVECQLVTPTALGNRLRLNPLIVFLWLILWGWMWGGAGMLIGVPLLVCVKIVARHLHSFDPWIQLLER